MYKIPKRYTGVVISVIMAFIMSCIMSAAMMMLRGVFDFMAWLPMWGVGFAIGLPTAIIASKFAMFVAGKVTK